MNVRSRPSSFSLGVALLWMLGSSAEAAPLQVWVQSPGTYGGDTEIAPTAMKTIELAALPRSQIKRMDVQYGSSLQYRGMPLRQIVETYAPPAQVDLLLLYFRNGMIVPLPFRNAQVMARLNPFVALEMRSTEQEPWLSRFPSIEKHLAGYADIPQVMFSGNKLVVSERWHPDVPASAQTSFTPWQMVDSLSGIAFADSSAYYRQFDPAPQVHQGFEQYRQNCQYCHGVHNVGARFGWDLGQAASLHDDRKDPLSLYYHIRYRLGNRTPLEQMPILRHIAPEQAEQLWRWMQTVSTTPTPRYSPAR